MKYTTLQDQIARARERLAALPERERRQLELHGTDPYQDRSSRFEASSFAADNFDDSPPSEARPRG